MEQYCCEVEPENVPDLVAVIRCKDCKHWAPWARNFNGVQLGRCAKDNNQVWAESLRYPNWFCADGEPKDKQLAHADNDTAQYADAPTMMPAT